MGPCTDGTTVLQERSQALNRSGKSVGRAGTGGRRPAASLHGLRAACRGTGSGMAHLRVNNIWTSFLFPYSVGVPGDTHAHGQLWCPGTPALGVWLRSRGRQLPLAIALVMTLTVTRS